MLLGEDAVSRAEGYPNPHAATFPAMKRSVMVLCIVLGGTTAACKKSRIDEKPSAVVQEPSADAGEQAEAAAAAQTAIVMTVDAAQSNIGFVGAKVTDDHEGKFTSFDGKATLDEDSPKAVEFTVQMDSLSIEPEKLEGHLKSGDFFDVSKYATSSFNSSKIEAKADDDGATHEVTGDLTMRGVTKTIRFPATIEVDDQKVRGRAEFKVDRKDFGIEYPGMPDDLIKDDVLLDLDLVFPRGS